MDNNQYEVLVVDDIKNAARDYASLISSQTGLSVIWTESPQSACDYAAQNELKVIVLDQRMPVLGTDLKEMLMKYCPDAKYIMLTGEASKDEIGSAVNLGYKRYLNKANITSLPNEVLSLYAEYEHDFSQYISSRKPIKRILEFNKCLPFLVYVYEKRLINNCYIDERQKKTIYRILAGEQKEFKNTVMTTEELVIGSQVETSGSMQLKDPIGSVGIIESALKKTFSLEGKLSVQKSFESSVKYELPSTDGGTIVQRVIDAFPVYYVYKVYMGYRMLLGGTLKKVVSSVRLFTGTYIIKQIDYYLDNTTKEIDLGTY